MQLTTTETEASQNQRYAEGWYIVVPVNKLKVNQPFAVDICGKALLVVQQPGKTAAVIDRACPHMGVDLATGKICDGAIVCAYHGAAFSLETGNYEGTAFVSPIRLRSYPSVERYGWIWFYNGTTPRYELPEFDPELYTFSFQKFQAEASMETLMLNALDSLHFQYIHNDLLTTKVPQYYDVAATSEYSFRCQLNIEPEARGKLSVEVMDREVFGPSMSVNAITVGGHTEDYRIYAVCPLKPRLTTIVLVNCTLKKRVQNTNSAYLPQLVPPWLGWLVPNSLFYLWINFTLFRQDLQINKNVISERRSPDMNADKAAIMYFKVLKRLRS